MRARDVQLSVWRVSLPPLVLFDFRASHIYEIRGSGSMETTDRIQPFCVGHVPQRKSASINNPTNTHLSLQSPR